MLCSVVKQLGGGRSEHSRSGEKHSSSSRVFPYTSFMLYRFLSALQEQSVVEASLFVNYHELL